VECHNMGSVNAVAKAFETAAAEVDRLSKKSDTMEGQAIKAVRRHEAELGRAVDLLDSWTYKLAKKPARSTADIGAKARAVKTYLEVVGGGDPEEVLLCYPGRELLLSTVADIAALPGA